MQLPTYGIANTDPLEMNENIFSEWLQCIPEERREEWQTRYNMKKYNFPDPATPEENAKIIDWRFQAYTLELQEIEISKGKFKYGETYSYSEITDTAKLKGKANKNATIFFTIPIY